MKLSSNNCLVALMAAALTLISASAMAAEIYDEEFPAESGGSILLEMKHGGSVIAQGWDRDLVRIIATERVNDREDYDIDVSTSRGRLKFVADINDRRINNTNLKLKIMVPRRFDIAIKSGGGGIEITDVEGEFTGSTGGGQIVLTKVKGLAKLKTGGGKIAVFDCELDGKVSTGGGEAKVKDVVGNLRVTSGGGNVSYVNVRDEGGERRLPNGLEYRSGISDETVIYTTAGGGIDISEAPEGAMVSTGGGNIHIRKAERFVRAKTGGGDIEIDVSDGSVVASTGAGDIEVSVSGGLGDDDDASSLMTGYGDITVILPRDISVDLDLDLQYTRNSKRDFEISSDFDLDIERTEKWDYEHGSPRKHIYGTAVLGDGGYRLKVRTVNGNIRIRKQ